MAINDVEPTLRITQSDSGWVKRFVLFHNKRHPSEMGAPEVLVGVDNIHISIRSCETNHAARTKKT